MNLEILNIELQWVENNLSCPYCPAQVDPSMSLSVQEDMSCPGCLVLAVLSRLSCPGCLSWLSCPDCPGPRSCHEISCPPPALSLRHVLTILPCPSCTVLAVLSCLSSPFCLVWLYYPGCLVLAILSQYSIPVPVVFSRLFCLCCYFLAVLSSLMSWQS